MHIVERVVASLTSTKHAHFRHNKCSVFNPMHMDFISLLLNKSLIAATAC